MLETLLQEPELAFKGQFPHLSFSRINRYLHCPEQYRLYYVENLRPKAPSATLVFGQLVHQALAHLFQKQGDPVKYFLDTWQVLKGATLNYSQKDSWEKLKETGEKLLRKFVAEELPKLGRIAAVEQPFELNLTNLDLPFVGVIDLEADLEGQRTVVDFKTAGSAHEEDEAELSDQLSAYQLAKPLVALLALCVLVKTKEPKIEWHFTRRNGEQLREYLAKAGYVAHEIAAGRFYKRSGMWCSWCDYRPLCVGDTRKANETLVKIQ